MSGQPVTIASSIANSSSKYPAVHLVNRQYVYITTTVPETSTVTRTIYQTLTSHSTFTEYALKTVTIHTSIPSNNKLDVEQNRKDEILAASAPFTETITTTSEIAATRTVYTYPEDIDVSPEKDKENLAADTGPVSVSVSDAFFTMTRTVTQRSTVTDIAKNTVKTTMVTVPRTKLVTAPAASVITVIHTVTTTVYVVSITGTTTIKQTVTESLITDAAITGILPRYAATSITLNSSTIEDSVVLQDRGLSVTVIDVLTPTATVVVTKTVTVPGVWFINTIYTGTTTIQVAVDPSIGTFSASTKSPTKTVPPAPRSTVTDTVVVLKSGTRIITTIGAKTPSSVVPKLPTTLSSLTASLSPHPRIAEGTTTILVTVKDVRTISEASAATVENITHRMTHWVTSTVVPPRSTTTKTATVTTTIVSDEIYQDYIVSTRM